MEVDGKHYKEMMLRPWQERGAGHLTEAKDLCLGRVDGKAPAEENMVGTCHCRGREGTGGKGQGGQEQEREREEETDILCLVLQGFLDKCPTLTVPRKPCPSAHHSPRQVGCCQAPNQASVESFWSPRMGGLSWLHHGICAELFS